MKIQIDKKEILSLTMVLILACFFRLWQLNSIPPGLYPDEAINGNDAISNPGKVFYQENNGREGLFINLIFLSFKIFGASVWALRFVPAIIGILTVFGLYLLTKKLFRDFRFKYGLKPETIAILSSFFLAVSFWHTNFSRIAFRGILVPFLLVFSFYFLFKGFRNKKLGNFILSGITFALGFYTYIAFRFAVLILTAILFFEWLEQKRKSLKTKKILILNTLYFLLTTILVALPIGIYFLLNPQYFLARSKDVSVFGQANPLKALTKSLISHLGMFHFYGDLNWRHNIAGFPVLFWPVGILFLIGFLFSVKEIIKSIKRKDYSLVRIYSSLFIWWLVMLLPGILTYEGIPHALRCIGAIPPTFIFAGLGGTFIFEAFRRKVSLKPGGFSFYLITFSSVLLFISFVSAQSTRYFVIWAKNPAVMDAFTNNLVEVGNYLNSLPETTAKYVVVNQPGVPVPFPTGMPMPAQTPIFIETAKFGKSRTNYLLPAEIKKNKIKKGATVVLMTYDKEIIIKLLLMFPEGKIDLKNGIWIYKT